MQKRGLPGVLMVLVVFLIILSKPCNAQKLDWFQLDENEAQFGFIGYQGARKNVAIDGLGNTITCAPFGNKVYVGNVPYTANFETILVKRNPAGQILWSRTLNGNGFKYGHSVHADSLGNIYLLGWYYGNSSINGNTLYSYGNYDCFLVKLNSSGTILYTKTFGSAGYDYPFALETDAKGNVWVAGKFAFSLQVESSTLSGASNSHFLLKLNPSGSLVYLKNICQNGSTDWGIGDLSRSNQGKIAVVSNYIASSGFQNFSLSGSGGYVAIIDANSGNMDTVIKAGSQAWLADHEAGGNLIILGLQTSNSDSFANKKLPALNATNQLYLARLLSSNSCDLLEVLPKLSGSYLSSENLRTLHVSRAGQIFISGELESPIYMSTACTLNLHLPHAAGKPQAVLMKLNEYFRCQWFAGVGSNDTLALPNKNIGAGIYTDAEGNIVWCTMNDAYSVVSTQLVLNNDTFVKATATSRYAAHGIHIWKFSEPSVRTFSPIIRAYCPGDSIHVQYGKFGIFESTNTFTLELSDTNGSFIKPSVLSLKSDTASGVIHALIPILSPRSDLYRLRVRASAPFLNGSITEDVILIRGKPNASAGPDFYFCLGDTLHIKASGGGSYLWNQGNSVLQYNQAELIAFPDTHSSYQVRVTDSISSCFNYDTVTAFYREQVLAKAIPDTLVCSGAMLNIRAELVQGDTNRLSFLWYDESGILVTSGDSFKMQLFQKQRFRLIVWDSCSILRDTQYFSVSVRDPLKLKAIADTLVCSNRPLHIQALASGGDPLGYQFFWMDSSFQSLFQHSPDLDSLFQQTTKLGIIIKDGCSLLYDSLVFSIQVAKLPEILHVDSARLCYDDSICLFSQTAGGYLNQLEYSWDGNAYDQKDSFIKSYPFSEYVKLSIRDACGIVDNDSGYVAVRTPLSLASRSDSLICKGESLLMFVSGAESDTGYYSFFWNGSPQVANYFKIQPATNHDYTVRVLDNCTGSELWDTILIKVRDSLSIRLVADTPICYGSIVDLKPLASGGLSSGYSFLWTKEDGSFLSVSKDLQILVLDSFKAGLELKDGCSTHSDSIRVEIYSLPPLSIEAIPDTLLCYGQFFQLVPKIKGGLGKNYRWSGSPYDSTSLVLGGEDFLAVQQNLVLDDGCSETYRMSFNILKRDPLFIQLPEDTFLCHGSQLSVHPVVNGGISNAYQYEFQGKKVTNIAFNLKPGTDSSFVYCITDQCSREYCDSFYIKIKDLPDASFTLSDSAFCVPYDLSLFSPFLGKDAYWVWTVTNLFEDSIRSTPDLRISIDKPGIYRTGLWIRDLSGCTNQGPFHSLIAHPKPKAFFTRSDSVRDVGKFIEFIIPDQQVTNSIWSPAVVEALSHLKYRLGSADTGLFSIQHIAANSWGCMDTFESTIRFKDPFLCYVPNAFNPNGRPENKVFLPSCESSSYYVLVIYNCWGAVIFQTEDPNKGWDGTMNGAGDIPVQGGVYYYRLKLKNIYGESIETNGNLTLLR